ncbi:SIS domain-containing protein [Nibricoccus sp. IMCC34717]|uniref:SIS domain-containing protein n=1 Tax=Nibricoccus sp. IMCC34717 TaxID=3034021 RepID=UPI00384F1F18
MNAFLNDILAQHTELKRVLESVGTPALQGGFASAADHLRQARRVVLTSMGSALYSLLPMYHELRRTLPNVQLAETAELQAHEPFPDETVYVIMSRSGESGEIAAFSETLRRRGGTLIAIGMTPGSTLAKNATVFLHDIATFDGFICTKAYSSMALLGLLLVDHLRGELGTGRLAAAGALADWMGANQARAHDTVGAHAALQKPDHVYFLSHGTGMAAASAGQLWTEEAARIPSAASTLAMFRHGPIEQVDAEFCGVAFDLGATAASRAQRSELLAKKPRLLTVAREGDGLEADVLLPRLELPEGYLALGAALVAQLSAYHAGVSRGETPGEMRYLNWIVK